MDWGPQIEFFSGRILASYAGVFSVATQRGGEERCVTWQVGFGRGTGDSDEHRYAFFVPFSKKTVSGIIDYLSSLFLTWG